MSSQRTALITGGTGAIGRPLLDLLRESGWRVRLMSRNPARFDGPRCDLELFTGDVTDRAAVERAVSGADVIFHLATLLHVAGADASLSREYTRVNVEGTANIVEAACRFSAERVVLFSTINVYGPTFGTSVDESTPAAPETPYGRSKLEAERIALAALDQAGKPIAAVLRLAAVYGPGLKANYRRLLDAIAAGRFLPIGSGRNRRTLVYDKDVAQAALAAATSPQAAGRIYNVTDGSVHPMSEIIAAIAESLGRRAPRFSLPGFAARIAAPLAHRMGGATGRRLAASVRTYLEDVAVDGDLIQRELGFAPRYDLRRGWAETVSLLRAAGELAASRR